MRAGLGRAAGLRDVGRLVAFLRAGFRFAGFRFGVALRALVFLRAGFLRAAAFLGAGFFAVAFFLSDFDPFADAMYARAREPPAQPTSTASLFAGSSE